MDATERFLAAARGACTALAQEHGGSWLVVRRVGEISVDLTGTGGDDSPGRTSPSVGRRLLPLDDIGGFALVTPTTVVPDVSRLRQALADARADEADAREADARPADGDADPTTGLGSVVTWHRVLAGEDRRCALLGHPAVVAVIAAAASAGRCDPDQDSRSARRCAAALRRSLRPADVVCLLGAGDYRVLAVECDARHASVLEVRLQAALLDVGIAAVIGAAAREPVGGLSAAADRAGKRLSDARARQRILRI